MLSLEKATDKRNQSLTKVSYGNDVHHSPDKVGGLPTELKAKLLARPAASAVTADDILGVDNLTRSASGLGLAQKIRILVAAYKIAPEETVRHLARVGLLGRRGLLLGQLAELDRDGVRRFVVDLRLVDL